MAGLVTVIGKVGSLSTGWCMACILSVIGLFMIVVKGNGWPLVSLEPSCWRYPWGMEQRYATKQDALLH